MSTTEIREHVTALFEAFLAGDIEALKAGRVDDWKGFQIKSTSLIRGVDEYQAELEKVIWTLKVERYEFLDFEVDVYDDLALVFYVARDHLEGRSTNDDPKTVLIRSLDVYRRVAGDWAQIASNICVIADDGR